MHGEAPLTSFVIDKLKGFNVKLTTASYDNEDMVASLLSMNDDQADKALKSYVDNRDEGARGRYHVFILPQTNDDGQQSPPRLIVGQYRHAWIRCDGSRLMEALAASCPSLASTLLSSLSTDIQPPLSAAGEAILSFSLYNAKSNLSSSYATWDFPSFEDRYLSRFIEALSHASIRTQTQSQVMLFGKPSINKGPWSKEKGAFVIRESKLTEWMSSWTSLGSGSLGSSISSTVPPHLLHFVAYVPPSDQEPLCILSKTMTNNECSRNFFIPSWGGVYIINGSSSRSKSEHWHLSSDESKLMAMSFITHLRTLLGLPSLASYSIESKSINLSLIPASSRGISEWELDALTRRRVIHNLESVAKVLKSLSLTVEQIPRLEMPDAIGSVVTEALGLIERIKSIGEYWDYGMVSQWAQEASGLAEQAFSNPAILAQLSHPESHDLGVYVPLFLPLVITILGAFVREVKFLRKQSDIKNKVD